MEIDIDEICMKYTMVDTCSKNVKFYDASKQRWKSTQHQNVEVNRYETVRICVEFAIVVDIQNSTSKHCQNIEFEVKTALEIANRYRTDEIWVKRAIVLDTCSKLSNSTLKQSQNINIKLLKLNIKISKYWY